MSDAPPLRSFGIEALTGLGAAVSDGDPLVWVQAPESVQRDLEVPGRFALSFDPERSRAFEAELVAPGSYFLERLVSVVTRRGRWDVSQCTVSGTEWISEALRESGLDPETGVSSRVDGIEDELLLLFAFRVTLVSDEKREGFHLVAVSLVDGSTWPVDPDRADRELMPHPSPEIRPDLETAYRLATESLRLSTGVEVERFRTRSLGLLEEEVPRDRGDRPGMVCAARGARLRKPSPLDLEAVRGRILLDEERGPVKLRRELLEDPGRDLEAPPRAVHAHEIRGDVVGLREVPHQRLQIGAFDDSLEEGSVLRDDVPWMRDVLRASFDAGPELPAVLVAARAIVDGRLPTSLEDPKGDRVGSLDAVRKFVFHLVSVDLHPREVGLGELHLVQVHEREALGSRPLDQPDEVGLALRDQRHLKSDGQAEGPCETRRPDEGTAGSPGPEAGRHMESDLIQAGLREPPDLVCVRRHRVEMRVELRPELALQQADVMAGALDCVEGVSAGDPGAGRLDRVRFFQDVLVLRDALFVREHDVLVHLLVGHGTVEAVEGANARDEEDHLRAVRALAAADRKGTAGESAKGSLLKAHASTKGRGGIKIPHRETPVGRPMDPGRRRRSHTSKWSYDSPQSAVRSEPASARTPAPRSGDRRPFDARDPPSLFRSRRGRRSPLYAWTDRGLARSARSRSNAVRRTPESAPRSRFPFSYL